jgi:hypothetical protein
MQRILVRPMQALWKTNRTKPMKLQWKTPQNCDGSLIQFAEPKEGTRFYVIRPKGKKAGDKWMATISVGCKGHRASHTRGLTDDVPQEKAKEACEDHWKAVRALDSQNA